jgi:hypothetical protein
MMHVVHSHGSRQFRLFAMARAAYEYAGPRPRCDPAAASTFPCITAPEPSRRAVAVLSLGRADEAIGDQRRITFYADERALFHLAGSAQRLGD